MSGQAGDQVHEAAPHQRFAASQAQLARPQPYERRTQPVQLLDGQHLGLGQEGRTLAHAVDAAEVAPVGDRHAQIIHHPAEGIDQGRAGAQRFLERGHA
jgi:hypothetical protein